MTRHSSPACGVVWWWARGARYRVELGSGLEPRALPLSSSARKPDLVDPWTARRLMCADPSTPLRALLCQLADRGTSVPDAGSPHELERWLSRALDEGRLVLLREAEPAVPSEGRRPPPDSDPASASEDAWLDLALQDGAGAPIGDVSYEVELPDGTIRAGMLDSDGRASLRNIDPGACIVRFPEVESGELPGG